jgi:hypothetical protein
VALCKVDDFDQAEALLRAIEPQPDAVLRQNDAHWFGDGLVSGVEDFEFRERLRLCLDPGQDIVKGRAKG